MGIKRNEPPVKCRGTKAMNKNNWKPFSLHHIMYSMTPPCPKIVPIWLEFQSLNPYKRIRLNQIQKKKPHIWYNNKKSERENRPWAGSVIKEEPITEIPEATIPPFKAKPLLLISHLLLPSSTERATQISLIVSDFILKRERERESSGLTVLIKACGRDKSVGKWVEELGSEWRGKRSSTWRRRRRRHYYGSSKDKTRE